MTIMMPENPLYWIRRGYSEEAAAIEAVRRKGGRSKWNPNYYILRGYSEEDAAILSQEAKKTCKMTKSNRLARFGGDVSLYQAWVDNTCSLSKKNMLKTMSEEEYATKKHLAGKALAGKRPSDPMYWQSLGNTAEDAAILATRHQRTSSSRCVEYWLHRGHSTEDAVIKVAEKQNQCSLGAFVRKYGDVVGAARYNTFIEIQRMNSNRTALYWMARGYSEEDAITEVSKVQTAYSDMGPHRVQFWLGRGYSVEEAEFERSKYVSSKFSNCVQFWLDRGYSEDEAKLLVRDIQKSRGIRGALAQRFKFKSQPESIFNDMTLDFSKIWTSHVKAPCGKHYFPDFEFSGCFVEIYGDYWHGNPQLYGPKSKLAHGILAEEKWLADSTRIAEIQKITNKPVFIIWEHEIMDNIKLKEKINALSKYF